jgi:hypothetical protein
VYAATQRDGDKSFYAALLRQCEGSGTSAALQQQQQQQQQALQPPLEGTTTQQQVQQALAASTAQVAQLGQLRCEALLHGDTHAAVETLLGMRIFLGGLKQTEFEDWVSRTGYVVGGQLPTIGL